LMARAQIAGLWSCPVQVKYFFGLFHFMDEGNVMKAKWDMAGGNHRNDDDGGTKDQKSAFQHESEQCIFLQHWLWSRNRLKNMLFLDMVRQWKSLCSTVYQRGSHVMQTQAYLHPLPCWYPIQVSCRTRSFQPGYIVGFRRV
jgi:hypothetical protein